RIAWRDVAIFACGVGLGLAPALGYLAAHGLAPGPPSLAEVWSAWPEPLGVRLAKIPARAVKLVALALPLSAGFPDLGRLPGVVPSALFGALALGAVAIALAGEIRRGRTDGPPAALLAVPAAVFVAIYACSP